MIPCIILVFLNLTCVFHRLKAQESIFLLNSSSSATIWSDDEQALVVQTALDLFAEDYKEVFGIPLKEAKRRKADIIVATLPRVSSALKSWFSKRGVDYSRLKDLHEGYLLQVVADGKRRSLVIVGSDDRGTAYGLMTLSRMIGVSPWKWWADVSVVHRDTFALQSDFLRIESPCVAYRGFFLNDEDWGLMPWASNNYEPRMRAAAGGDPSPVKGEIGPYTHEKIFELMLRLKANLFWPAMHGCSKPFYTVDGNQQAAEKYGIIVSTSHCEPMMCNINGEWNKTKHGEYNWKTNRIGVSDYWEKRVKRLASTSDCVYTLGMRGTHDGPMEGYKGAEAQKNALSEVIVSQRELLAKHVNNDLTQVPQQFVPYKEVLDAYRSGLEVPDDVTLVWCDDNYGYIRHFPTAEEQKRSGGHGVYYHLSYWGRPHDYLWLATTSPALIHEQLVKGYDNGICRLWVMNVGDIKPAEYLISLTMDMAWNIDFFRSHGALYDHLISWYGEQLGISSVPLANIWRDYYNLSFAHRPEFLGGTRVEEKDSRWKQISDLQLNAKEIEERLSRCDKMLSDMLFKIRPLVPTQRMDAWFQLVEYPISAMVYQNRKHLVAQLARHEVDTISPSMYWERVREAERQIDTLTAYYNDLGNGKWKGMMSAAPRNLPVFQSVKEQTFSSPMPTGLVGDLVFVSAECIGHSIALNETFSCDLPSVDASDSIEVELHLLPLHPLNEQSLRFEVSIDGAQRQVCDIRTVGRSEEWKQNVLYNRALRKLKFRMPLTRMRHRLEIRPLDETLYLQKVIVRDLP